MPLPQPAPRQRKHTRRIVIEGFHRDDGLWDIEAHITDQKTRDFPLASGVRPVGQPVHDMHLRLTIDETLTVRDVEAVSDAVPYPGQCEGIAPAYRQLIGLNLLRGFRRAVLERLGKTAGCTHMTELATLLPTAAIQTFAGEVFKSSNSADAASAAVPTAKPFQIDGCHALRSDGEAVRIYYPRWYVGAAEDEASSDQVSRKKAIHENS